MNIEAVIYGHLARRSTIAAHTRASCIIARQADRYGKASLATSMKLNIEYSKSQANVSSQVPSLIFECFGKYNFKQ